jgi:hypothetical protein
MADRIAMAKASHLISDTCASNMRTVNTIRNKLAHYHPDQGWEVSYVQELSSANAFEECMNKGFEALDEAFRAMIEKMELKDYKPGSK